MHMFLSSRAARQWSGDGDDVARARYVALHLLWVARPSPEWRLSLCRKLKRVAVVGGGLMGSGIAAAILCTGRSVVVKEVCGGGTMEDEMCAC